MLECWKYVDDDVVWRSGRLMFRDPLLGQEVHARLLDWAVEKWSLPRLAIHVTELVVSPLATPVPWGMIRMPSQ